MIIKTPARLHITLLDLNGSYGRMDGGIGFSIQDPQFILEMEKTDDGEISIEFDEKITDEEAIEECNLKINNASEAIKEHYNIDAGFKFYVHTAFPPHSGFGSGTQIALATAKLITETEGIEADSVELSTIVGRGGTSGIGTYCFETGGFIADGGHSLKEKSGFLPSSASNACPPPIIGRYDFPQEWDVLVAIPPYGLSIHDGEEVNLFERFCPLPDGEVEELSHIVFMNLIPFMIEKDIEGFGWCIDEIHKRGFQRAELTLYDERMHNLMQTMRDAGAYGVGMSSFGPTVYTVVDEKNKDAVYKATREYLGPDAPLFFTKAQNSGYTIEK
ncbi:MAG: hypothetical protein MJ232_08470 [archaeon]|nr:hypothetical protein [archaeon]